jgi:hypothetical protein
MLEQYLQMLGKLRTDRGRIGIRIALTIAHRTRRLTLRHGYARTHYVSKHDVEMHNNPRLEPGDNVHSKIISSQVPKEGANDGRYFVSFPG